jgi:transcriptional regulator with XRE-family HTH domain
MPDVIQDRNIPVKHNYSVCDFSESDNATKVAGMNNTARIRKARGLSQVELAHRVGVEQPTISRFERGSESITLRQVKAIADVLGVSVADLFAERSEAEDLILQVFRDLPPHRQEGWLDMARAILSEKPDR